MLGRHGGFGLYFPFPPWPYPGLVPWRVRVVLPLLPGGLPRHGGVRGYFLYYSWVAGWLLTTVYKLPFIYSYPLLTSSYCFPILSAVDVHAQYQLYLTPLFPVCVNPQTRTSCQVPAHTGSPGYRLTMSCASSYCYILLQGGT